MKRSLQIVSVLILLPFIGKILFLETGLLAQSMYQLSMICHCNHGSKNEIHKEESSPTNRITCHLTKGNGLHPCSCTKRKSATKTLQSQSMNPSFNCETQFIQLITYDTIILSFFIGSHLPSGFSHLPYKPPRNLPS
ncbi:LIC_11090 family protein [Leptospira brenneri]|uniref:Uncharacterized protein n=1 Tax=Leptospira brenneri TaxID=2023182 RepID=A0A2M9Y449_9LEPT|nr:hypothetical protein [Leptospira brenneri]PJZ46364.1 hypothetical protein CH361_04510 [Leptospira brenneri]TGK96464.1 hypothetical protein EHQ30_07630 [Leptospira brenneri]